MVIKMSDFNDDDLPTIDNSIEEAAAKLNIDINYLRPFSHEEILYLLDLCPFIQMVNPEAALDAAYADGPQSVTAQSSDWTILDYGDAMTSSPGRFIFGGGYARLSTDEEDEEGGGGAGPIRILTEGKGTIRAQTFNTAADMVALAKSQGWEVIQIVDGHPNMIRDIWIHASKQNIKVEGFEPSEADLQVQARVELSESELEVLRQTIRPAAG
jgi:hypothetical protein